MFEHSPDQLGREAADVLRGGGLLRVVGEDALGIFLGLVLELEEDLQRQLARLVPASD